MKKLSNEELGTLVSREMMSMMLDASLSYEQRAKLFCAIVNDEPIEDGMMSAFANSLKVGFIRINNNRIKGVEARRKRQKEYQRNLRTSTEIKVDEHTSTEDDIDERTSTMQGNAKHSIAKQSNNIPLYPPCGGVEKVPAAISVEEILALPETTNNPIADMVVAEIDSTYPFKANGRKLRRCVFSILKKNTADEILNGFRAHVEAWKSDEWEFAPHKICDWLYDHKYLDPVIQKKNRAAAEEKVASGCGSCGVEIA